MSIKELVAGGVITLVIGGTAYTVSQADVAKNFADDTGLTTQEAEQYVNGVTEEDLVSYDVLGTSYVADGQQLIDSANKIDCINYEYEWAASVLACEDGKAHLLKTGGDEILLGEAFIKLNTNAASRQDITSTIELLDTANENYRHEIFAKVIGEASVDETMKNNSYNKALLKAALDSNN